MALSESLYNQTHLGFITVIDLLGVPCTHRRHTDGLPTPIPSVGFSSISRVEEPFIQAYGINGKVITVKISDLPEQPTKFDLFEVKGERYIADLVRVVHLNDTPIGWKIFCKGK
jgi:hypothetical protein